MRLDRILSVYWFYPLRRLARRENGLRIPILMYHSVSGRDECSHHPYYETNVRPEVFIRQMQYLADRHFQVISLSEAVSMLTDRPGARLQHPEAGHSPTKAYCVLTFDDGFRDFFHTAWPILEQYKFASTVFLPTGRISDERQGMGTRDCLTWGEVKTLAAVGVEFGAHTVSHVQLYDLVSARREKDKRMLSSVIKKESFAVPSKKRTDGGPTPIEYELLASKAKIENTLGKSVSYYSYAYAFPEQDRAFVGMYETALRQAGYRAAVSTRVGTARHGDNPYTLRRIPVNSYDDPLLFRAKLAGAYDWLARPQLLSKLLRAGRAC